VAADGGPSLATVTTTGSVPENTLPRRLVRRRLVETPCAAGESQSGQNCFVSAR
jgi:hypothetical protein